MRLKVINILTQQQAREQGLVAYLNITEELNHSSRLLGLLKQLGGVVNRGVFGGYLTF